MLVLPDLLYICNNTVVTDELTNITHIVDKLSKYENRTPVPQQFFNAKMTAKDLNVPNWSV